MPKRKYLDEVSYLDENGRIHFDVPKKEQGEIRQEQKGNKVSKAVNNYFRKFKYIVDNNKIPGGEYTIPAAIIAGAVPSTIKSIANPYINSYYTSGLKGVALTGVRNAIEDAIGGAVGSVVSKPLRKNLDEVPAKALGSLAFGAGAATTRHYLDNVERRAIETAMRTTSKPDFIGEILYTLPNIYKNDKTRLKHIANYIISGRKKGPKGYYNSFNTSNKLIDSKSYYTGFMNVKEPIQNDMIDAFLYGRDISGLNKIAVGKEFGVHAPYINRYYRSKANNIPVYETITKDKQLQPYHIMDDWHGETQSYNHISPFDVTDGSIPDVGGYLEKTGLTEDGISIAKGQDIWKFNPNDFLKRYEVTANNKFLNFVGLHEVDRLGTPVIVRTPWVRLEQNYDVDDIFKYGGSIHIKPSHRGRLTELKARTGKTESELYNDGNPAHKKMVVFARNARKWKH